MHRCSTCSVEKPFDEFPIDRRSKTGFGYSCKSCRTEYQRQWYQKNREHHLSNGKQNILKNPSKRKSYERTWYERNRARVLEACREYRYANKELVQEKDRSRYAKDPSRYLSYSRKREAAQRLRMPAWYGEFDQFVFEEAYELAKRREVATAIAWHVDHMYPLRSKRVSGLHVGLNAQVIPASMNLAKGNSLSLTQPCEWIKRL